MKFDNIQQIYERFLQLEAKENLFESIQINHIKIWHYIRYEIYGIITYIFGIPRNPNEDKKFYDKQDTLADWIDENIVKNQFRICHKDILIINHTRRVKQKNYYKCVYTDEWLKFLDKSYYVYENPYSEKFHFKPVGTKNLRYIDIQKFMKYSRKEYHCEIHQKEAKEVTFRIIKMLENEFEIVLSVRDRKRIEQMIKNSVLSRDLWRNYYDYLLKHIKPKLVVYVVGYGIDRLYLAELCKELGIPTVELQHGHIGKGHLAYNFKIKSRLNALPDYLFVTGQHEIDTMRFPIPKRNIYITGSPELDIKTEYYAKKMVSKKKKKKIITFISSGEQEIADAAVELYQKLDKDKYKIYLKLHPSQYTNWKKKFRNLQDSGVCVVDDNRHNIYYYLAVSDYLIGIASTVLFEATRFTCDIMILKKGRYFNSDSLIQKGIGIFVNSTDEIMERINSQNDVRQESDYFYCRNSCQLIYNAIDEILNQ